MKIKNLILAICMFFNISIVFAKESCPPDSIYGKWQWYKYIYEGAEYPPNNPDLILTLEYDEKGISHLYWTRKGQKSFCERMGNYVYLNCQMMDQVTWVNPENGRDCGSDPDMQMGRITSSPLSVRDGDLHLELSLSGKPFIYVWKKLNKSKH